MASTPTFYQGSAITLEFYLQETEGVALSLDKYLVTFFLKKSEFAENILFRTDITENPIGKAPGVYVVTLPTNLTATLRPGVYYYAIQATQKASGGVLPPFRGCFSLELSAASPNPNLTIQDGEPTAIGPMGTADEFLIPAENTGPNTPDIGKHF